MTEKLEFTEEPRKPIFEVLSAVDVNEHTEKKKSGSKDLTYLSWAWAWSYVKMLYPSATYEVHKNERGLPFFEDKDLGIMCYTTVTIDGETHDMWLPVMDGANMSMKRVAYQYDTKNGTKSCAAASMNDVNKAVMRCLVKNLAMFGLGIYIYAGEDLPTDPTESSKSDDFVAHCPVCEKRYTFPAGTTQAKMMACCNCGEPWVIE